ncbi:MAG: bifunctional demethylmenaquinone methyltransferase/2-methoxy-6-polyprenyl-1,4-benzoquinol methylase UbiE [Flavobacteriales bacterium]
MGTKITPYKQKDISKKEQVATMFDAIASRYDFLNHFLSLGIDIIWRNRAIKAIKKSKPKIILDIATGTGDLAISANKLKPNKVIGVDISKNMLNVGRNKISKKGLSNLIDMQYGDCENLNFEENYFDAITAGFGVRNFENLNKGLSELYRVLKKEGQIVILEPSEPKHFPFKQLYLLYFKIVLPLIGKLFSKDQSAYTYLPDSVAAFPSGQKMLDKLKEVGFKNTKHTPLTFGIAAMYTAKK